LAWRKLNEKDRKQWEELARKDKARFEVEKSLYSGPWRVPTTRSLNHDPSNPKRPMSAFLAFSHAKRAEEKQKNPSFSNAELSRHLAQLWKDALNEEKKFFLEQEFSLRQKYLVDKAAWRLDKDKEFQQERKYREDMAMKKVSEHGNDHLSDSCAHPLVEQAYSGWRTASSRNDGLWTPYDQPIALSPYASYDSPYQYYHGQPSGTYSGLECSSYSNQFYHRESHSPLYHCPQEFSNHERGRTYHSECVAYPPESDYAAPQYSETLPIEVYNNFGQYQGNSK
jgi:HMG (high mobility group) box